ncbi:MAG: oligoendopeptidase F [Deltaproteobacteria bacterium]|nr:oligoendopeptidase F [Deltaproteobacteria bacterium]
MAPTATAPATAAPVAPAAGTESMGIDANQERSQIAERYKWKLDPIFPGDEGFEQGLKQVATMRADVARYRGKLVDPAKLAECLKLYFDTRLLTRKLTLYAALRFDSHQKSAELQGLHEQSQKALHELMSQASFIRQEVMALDDRAMDRAYRRAPALAEYRPYLDELRRRRMRVLGGEAERVLALAGDNLWAEIDLNEIPSDIEKVIKALRAEIVLPTIKDEQGAEVQLTLANFGKYRGSSDRRVRRDTVEAFFATLRSYQSTFAAALAGQMKLNVQFARSRGYDTALEAYLDKDNIDPEVYRSLIRSIGANVAPLHRYVRLRKKLMNVDELHIYDLYAPMVKGSKMQVPYDEALEIMPKALAPLGDEYLSALRTGLAPQNGWVDVFPHKDKESGAFSIDVYGIHPYIKMNYFGEVDDFSTLAHEFGHAIHSHLSMTNQPYMTASYAPFIAEIASTLNEKLLSDYLLERASNDDERLYILNNLVETIRTTIYRQTLFAEFELLAHTAVERGEALTAEFFNRTYQSLIRKYYGPDFTLGPNDELEWAYIPHFYYKYYVFAYATGLSSGIALADRVKTGGATAREAYLGMLRGGSSKPPLVLLKEAGVDLTKPDAIEAAAKLLDQTLGRLETILAQRR